MVRTAALVLGFPMAFLAEMSRFWGSMLDIFFWRVVGFASSLVVSSAPVCFVSLPSVDGLFLCLASTTWLGGFSDSLKPTSEVKVFCQTGWQTDDSHCNHVGILEKAKNQIHTCITYFRPQLCWQHGLWGWFWFGLILHDKHVSNRCIAYAREKAIMQDIQAVIWHACAILNSLSGTAQVNVYSIEQINAVQFSVSQLFMQMPQ